MTKLYDVSARDKNCNCGCTLNRTIEIIYDNYIQMYSHCPNCKSCWTFDGYLHKEAINFYQD